MQETLKKARVIAFCTFGIGFIKQLADRLSMTAVTHAVVALAMPIFVETLRGRGVAISSLS